LMDIVEEGARPRPSALVYGPSVIYSEHRPCRARATQLHLVVHLFAHITTRRLLGTERGELFTSPTRAPCPPFKPLDSPRFHVSSPLTRRGQHYPLDCVSHYRRMRTDRHTSAARGAPIVNFTMSVSTASGRGGPCSGCRFTLSQHLAAVRAKLCDSVSGGKYVQSPELLLITKY